MPAQISNQRRYLAIEGKRSTKPSADAPSAMGTARPKAKADSSMAPIAAEAVLAATPKRTASAGVHTGQTAIENGAPSANSLERG